MREARVGRYRLEGVIGVGSFATVHRAKDERLDDTVVIKLLAENHSLNPEVRERFIAEGRSLRRVSSPHVITVHDIGESDRQQPYLVLEYADRGTLADRVAALRSSGWTARVQDVLVVARSLAAALEAVHAAHLVHRDLSPANVLLQTVPGVNGTAGDGTPGEATAEVVAGSALVRPDERLLVVDLGMCKDLALNSGLTVAGGTSGFRPPEMLGGPAVIDTRADLFSLSALLTWLCRDADLPAELDLTLARSLAVDPAARHPDVAAWLADVETALAPKTLDTASASGEPQVKDAGAVSAGVPPARKRPRMVARIAAMIAALAIGVASGLVLSGLGDPTESTQSARIAIEGPEELTVGEPVTFTARHTGITSWVWVLPSGEHLTDRDSVTITPQSSGSAEVVLRARDASGEDLQVVHHLQVSD